MIQFISFKLLQTIGQLANRICGKYFPEQTLGFDFFSRDKFYHRKRCYHPKYYGYLYIRCKFISHPSVWYRQHWTKVLIPSLSILYYRSVIAYPFGIGSRSNWNIESSSLSRWPNSQRGQHRRCTFLFYLLFFFSFFFHIFNSMISLICFLLHLYSLIIS